MKRATRRAARVAARGGQSTPRRRDAARAREVKDTTAREARASRRSRRRARSVARARPARKSGRDGARATGELAGATARARRTLAGPSSEAVLRRGLVRVVTGDMLVEGCGGCGRGARAEEWRGERVSRARVQNAARAVENETETIDLDDVSFARLELRTQRTQQPSSRFPTRFAIRVHIYGRLVSYFRERGES